MTWLIGLVAFLAQDQTAAVQAGRRWYMTQCANCHGVNGDGGRGANLATPNLRHAASHQDLLNVIARGIPGTEMPRSALTATQVAEVAAFVKTLGQTPRHTPPGDAAAGERLFHQHCRRCHTLNGQGGPVGPDLSGLGGRSSPGFIRTSITAPDAATPRSYARIRATPQTGAPVQGVLLGEDTFSIRLYTLDGSLKSFWKSEARIEADRRSLMPALPLAPGDIDNLTAFLAAQ